MKRFKHILNSIKAAWFYYKNPQTLQTGALEMLKQIMEMLVKSQEMNIPMRCHMKIQDETVMHLWCSTGLSPEQRIDQLLLEKKQLTDRISELEMKIK